MMNKLFGFLGLKVEKAQKEKEDCKTTTYGTSQAQKDLYRKLAAIKRSAMSAEGIVALTDKELDIIDRTTLSAKIARLQTLIAVFPASQKQLDLIKSLCERNGLPLPKNFENMQSSEASLFIDKINAFQRSKPALATEKQLERIKLYIGAGLITKEIDLMKIQKNEAFELIESLEDAYREWRDNSVTGAQINYIQNLQERLGDVVLPIEELRMMSRKTASSLIDQLSTEWKNRDQYAKSFVVNYKDLTDRSKEREELMKLNMEQRSFEEKCDMISKLFVVIGQQPEELELVNYNTVDEVLMNMLALARMYVSDEEIETSLGIDIEEIGAEA
ncbi:MAG: hypothetical protein PHY47_12850 [Lachnospiraceae bacterium]|nr:hypothetical protein [Lachnospiraceae bacterium]